MTTLFIIVFLYAALIDSIKFTLNTKLNNYLSDAYINNYLIKFIKIF